jgi:hypothetical protein
MESMTNAAAIKTFFEKDGGRKITMQELKDCSPADRQELGKLAAEQLGVTIQTV